MTNSILIGVDSSTPSRSALLWGIARAEATKARLELLHVIDGAGLARDSAEWHSLHEAAVELLRHELAFARSVAPSLQIMTNTADGRAEDALARRSVRHSMLVVGTHKTGFIYGQTFGSRFLGLAWRALCDVAFIPDQAGSARRGVVAPAESSPTGEAIARFAAAEAAACAQELTLIASTRGEADRAGALALEAHHGLRVHARVSTLPPAEALIAASAGASLLVIGRSRSPRSSTLSRSANHDVLVNMACPVVVVCAR